MASRRSLGNVALGSDINADNLQQRPLVLAHLLTPIRLSVHREPRRPMGQGPQHWVYHTCILRFHLHWDRATHLETATFCTGTYCRLSDLLRRLGCWSCLFPQKLRERLCMSCFSLLSQCSSVAHLFFRIVWCPIEYAPAHSEHSILFVSPTIPNLGIPQADDMV